MKWMGSISQWFYKWSGIDRQLVDREGYLLFREEISRRDRFSIILAAFLSILAFNYAYFLREDFLAFWFWMIFGTIAVGALPMLLFLDLRRKPIRFMEIKNGHLRWRTDKDYEGFPKEGRLNLSEVAEIGLVIDPEGRAQAVDVTLRSGRTRQLPGPVAGIIMEACRNPFVAAVRHYQPTLEDVRVLASARS